MSEDETSPPRELSLYEIALVGGGAKRAVQTALATLITAGVVARTKRAYAALTPEVPADPLEAEVHVMAQRGALVQVLFLRVEHGPTIKAMKHTLLGEGYLEHSPLHLGATTASVLGIEELTLWRKGLGGTPLDDQPPTLALVVALFGAESLWKTDQDTAMQLGVLDNAASGTTGSADAAQNGVMFGP
jgi:hypothetical protein